MRRGGAGAAGGAALLTFITLSFLCWGVTPAPSRYASLTCAQLAVLVPELLLIGQMIDRSGMAWCIAAFGRLEMLQIAIEEYRRQPDLHPPDAEGASATRAPTSTPSSSGPAVDIGAPPQFMDFRYIVHDRWHGEF